MGQQQGIQRYLVAALCIAGWLVAAAVLESLLGELTLVTYTSVAIAGLFVIIEYANPRHVAEPWRTRINYAGVFAALTYVLYASYRFSMLL
jgi:hypothetical protein